MIDELFTDDITVGTVGRPGERVFYVQARDVERSVTLRAEKQQVAVLAQQLLEMLERLTQEHGPDPIEPTPNLALRVPFDEAFSIGAIALGYDPERDLVLVQFEEFVAGDTGEQDEPEDEDEPMLIEPEPGRAVVRIWTSRTRWRTVANHALEVVAGGRPQCELCGQPKGDDHVCARTNGRLRDTL